MNPESEGRKRRKPTVTEHTLPSKGLEYPPEHGETALVNGHILWKAALPDSFPLWGCLNAQSWEPDADKWKTTSLFKKALLWLESAEPRPLGFPSAPKLSICTSPSPWAPLSQALPSELLKRYRKASLVPENLDRPPLKGQLSSDRRPGAGYSLFAI